ncbi:Integrase [Tenacibaculum maritimum]|uniref:phage integrase SAM-like domain-containing protein n=1 Tax=Tenacibaculum maritimum TaxID=107401 RepID=UPI0012E44997|nr:phage integrase SAM-like domain-containing protein [Tenacibaculum maritimum]CAA0159597.1 Integrase [Tenacibaculum maritimum]CAA0230984.1 Integrase family protein [Tenacibaculum maritimum]
MANVYYSIRGNSNPTKIYMRLRNGRSTDIKVATNLEINPKYFNKNKGSIRRLAEYTLKDDMILWLSELKTYVLNEYQKSIKKGVTINSNWLNNCIKTHFNLVEVSDADLLQNYCTHYISKLKLKRNDKTGGIGVSKATEQKYSTIQKKIQAFDKYKRKKHKLIEINLNYRNEFLKYMLEIEKLGRNTAGRYLKFLKTICLDAQQSGYKVSSELPQIKGFSVEVEKIYLSFEELKQIENTQFKTEALQIAKDWLIIGCYIGQRAGDLLQLKENNITYIGGQQFVELTQQKTKKKVIVLLHPKVIEIIKKNNGNFPKSYGNNLESAKTIFNLKIKEVCKIAGLTQKIDGAKVNTKTNRKEQGIFEKWELVTSHICRRSFASNHYGELPTPLLLNVTGHSKERDFLNYIGKTPIDYAEQMAKYWTGQIQKQQLKENNEPAPMRVAK